MKLTKSEQLFLEEYKTISHYREASSLIAWDLRTKAPRKGIKQRSETLSYLSERLHQLQTSDRMKEFIDELQSSENPYIRRSIELVQREYEFHHKIPVEEFKAFVQLTSESESVWQEAKDKNDYSMFQPYLEKIVDYNIRFANYWGYEGHIYNAHLKHYEPGMTVDTLDGVFPKLQKDLSRMIEQVKASPIKPKIDQITVQFPKEKQEAFALYVLDQMGYDFEAGRLDETVHPFAIEINPQDVRVTTNYDEKDFRTAVFGTIHEGGHALYEQGFDPKLYGLPVCSATSMGIHESQSLFWENFIGRSKTFWDTNYPTFLNYAPESFKDLATEDFYRAINEVKPSFIRIEADEMTYALHIMLRYEIEKGLLNGDLKVKDLPEIWNDKMETYLGIQPPSDRQGVLQDIHWAGGDFGYFPSYALGYMYGAQFKHTLEKEINIEQAIEQNELGKIKEWLNHHIHQHGSMKEPLDLLHDVTGEGLNHQYLVEYLTSKYSDIYGISLS
ncbi:carboxypeptidase M32 [Allobacillus halotolerans]|uniref:Metal-dependent carboxypeptidase n=1 Tax=Allobacillus halotolerans TaxID=570278 RepID=A0ABS6GLG4_9BACI|nr:carboxypeptidase M32 [Allobacillus halotolerans]MBU6079475.1 carboxypeptidase M32 [Allobacillus halotolerans]